MPNIIFKWAIHGLFCLQLRANNNRFKLPITGFEPVLQTMPQQPIAHTEAWLVQRTVKKTKNDS